MKHISNFNLYNGKPGITYSTVYSFTWNDIARQSCAMVPKWRFFASCISSEPRAAHFRPAF